MRKLITLSVALLGLSTSSACGAAPMPREQALPQLRNAIADPVNSPEESQERSRLVQKIVDDGTLIEMFRGELEEAIGRGDACSRHPRCAENDFSGDDWFYTVGQMGESRTGALPILIVGFDTTGRVVKTWNLRTH